MYTVMCNGNMSGVFQSNQSAMLEYMKNIVCLQTAADQSRQLEYVRNLVHQQTAADVYMLQITHGCCMDPKIVNAWHSPDTGPTFHTEDRHTYPHRTNCRNCGAPLTCGNFCMYCDTCN